eukprot:CAMPEP_0168548638 /NCGR_PEP_ID=MMETSP0413-20121227/4674_1 /TAXON_ID=136452 /ORGANISM="Filamoeba nolandi, Strain NC-AS-23-1" /LENGTH=110 /DNA_ID=CAMNT_0008578967 /DNA_START=15 /DNA_END=344 /DNA_ORIENTATION=+
MEGEERKAKVEIKYSPGNPNSATFVFHGEDHTIGNALRYMCIRNADVGFCGYSVPHPSDDMMNIRIQMKDPNGDPISALRKGLTDLKEVGTHMLLTFENQVALFDSGLQD